MTREGNSADDDATKLAPVSFDQDATVLATTRKIDTTEVTSPTDPDATLLASPPNPDATVLASPPEPPDVTVIASSSPADGATRVISGPPVHQPPPRGQYQPGSLIRDRFLLVREIGRGGMGVVYIARDLRKEEAGDQDSLIAIKLLTEDFKQHPDALRMLQQETRKTQTLAHPNVVTVYDFDRDGETVYMTMEYLVGMPLTEYIKEHRDKGEDLETVLPIISDIVHGLQYAHDRGIVHSDLKPGNIFMTEEGVTKILDLGIARAIKGNERMLYDQDTPSQGTETRVALTPKYASPEMFKAAPPDPRDDIYALACITYELLTGRHPFNGKPAALLNDKDWPPLEIPGLKKRQWNGLLSGLALKREERCPSAREFLEYFLPKRKQPWRWAALGIAVIASVVTGYLLTRPPQEAPLSEADQKVVQQELEVAREHLEVGSLGDALETYKMILALPPYDKEPPGGGFVQHPYDHQALSDLAKLLKQMAEQARIALTQGRWRDAKAFVEAGLAVDKDNTELLELKDAIEKQTNRQ